MNLAESPSKTATSMFSYTVPFPLRPGATYYWKVVGKTMALLGRSSPLWSFTAAGPSAWPGAPEIAKMTAFAIDAWAKAQAQGTSVAHSGNEAGNTRNSRIDYIWFAKAASRLILKAAHVFDTRDASGVTPSDHRPVMATFEVGATAVTPPPPSGLRIMTGIGGRN